MAVQLAVPAGPARSIQNIDYFKGVDLYNAAANVSPYRSPEAPNMMRDEVGKVRKRMGYRTVASFPARINGVFSLAGKRLVHAGPVLYAQDDTPGPAGGNGAPEGYRVVREGLGDGRSRGVVFNDTLYLLDGKTFLLWDGARATPVSEGATVPTVLISKNPGGGGEVYQPVNLLSRWRTEQFLGNETDKVYRLSAAELDADGVKAETMQEDGTWKVLTEGTGFTVDRKLGWISFSTAPGKPLIIGVDNVRITYAKTVEGYAGRIDRCDVAVMYGVNGAADRLFVAGDPEHPDLDYYSEYDDPSYFGDTWFSQLGRDGAGIVGYSIVGNVLAAHKSDGGDGRNVVLRSGALDRDGKAVFPIVNALQGEGAVGKHAFAVLGSEPLFLTRRGVYAITTAELTGERYSQQRSLYLSTAIQGEETLEEAVGFVWREFYLLAVGRRVYLLDGLQKEYAKDEPHSGFQYEGYYWENVGARVFWEEGRGEHAAAGALCFGTGDGRLCRFHTDVDAPDSYNDDGAPILAYWDTADLSGQYFWKNKTFRYVAVRLAAAVVTGVKIFAQVRGLWRQVYDAGERARYLDWSYVNFAKFVFSADRTPRTLGGKIKLKKVDKARFRFQNGELNEPFGIYSIGFEYTEPGGRFKG